MVGGGVGAEEIGELVESVNQDKCGVLYFGHGDEESWLLRVGTSGLVGSGWIRLACGEDFVEGHRADIVSYSCKTGVSFGWKVVGRGVGAKFIGFKDFIDIAPSYPDAFERIISGLVDMVAQNGGIPDDGVGAVRRLYSDEIERWITGLEASRSEAFLIGAILHKQQKALVQHG